MRLQADLTPGEGRWLFRGRFGAAGIPRQEGWPHELFQSEDLQAVVVTPMYDVSAAGQRFLTSAQVEQGTEAAPPTIRVVQNWYEEFRDREQ